LPLTSLHHLACSLLPGNPKLSAALPLLTTQSPSHPLRTIPFHALQSIGRLGRCADTLTAPAGCTGPVTLAARNVDDPYQTWVAEGDATIAYDVRLRSEACTALGIGLYLSFSTDCTVTQALLLPLSAPNRNSNFGPVLVGGR